jgi:hypothetical protein
MDNFKFARRCDVTGEGMNEGWVVNSNNLIGLSYIKHEADALAHAQEQGYDSIDAMYEACEDTDEFYWTEWEELDEDGWYESPYKDGRDAVWIDGD